MQSAMEILAATRRAGETPTPDASGTVIRGLVAAKEYNRAANVSGVRNGPTAGVLLLLGEWGYRQYC